LLESIVASVCKHCLSILERLNLTRSQKLAREGRLSKSYKEYIGHIPSQQGTF